MEHHLTGPPAPARHQHLQLSSMAPAALLVMALAACGDGPPDRQPTAEPATAAMDDRPFDMANVTFAPETGVDPSAMTRTDEGIYTQDVRAGRGAEAQAGSNVSIEYRAWLPDGTLFEQRPSPDGFGLSEFTLGENPPVAGLNTGIAGMRPGGVRRIVLPPEHGYGLVGRPAGVPPRSVLIFEVRLLSVRGASPADPD